MASLCPVSSPIVLGPYILSLDDCATGIASADNRKFGVSVGVPGSDPGGFVNAGGAVVFHYSAGLWGFAFTPTLSVAAGDLMGDRVSVWGDYTIIGAPNAGKVIIMNVAGDDVVDRVSYSSGGDAGEAVAINAEFAAFGKPGTDQVFIVRR